MKLFTKAALLTAITSFLLAGSHDLAAQAGGGGGGGGGRNRGAPRDPAQFQAQRMDRYRQQLEVKSDDEWKIIQQRIEKVQQAEREARVGGFGGFRRGGPNNNNNNNNGAQTDGTNNRGRRGNQGGPPANTDSNPDVTALQAAVDSKASTDETKAKLIKLRETLKQKDANLAKAREELRQVLSVRQESIAILIGLLR